MLFSKVVQHTCRGFKGGTIISSLKDKNSDFKEFLRQEISQKGNMSFADYMRHCLTHPDYGYYCKGDVFGREGDFVTSPEISQLFGEMVGVWCSVAYQKFPTPYKWNIVELGPGKGTLARDVLRALRDVNCITGLNLHMIDVSPNLRKLQQSNMAKLIESWGQKVNYDSEDNIERVFSGDLNIQWYETLSQCVNQYLKHLKGYPVIVLCHEIFDAMPIYIFEYSSEFGWCEMQVGYNNKFELVRSQGPTQNVANVLQPSKRFKNPALSEGDRIELSPDSINLMHQICELMKMSNDSAGLVIDYGDERAFGNSLRAIKQHKYIEKEEWLQVPGQVDLSAHVDFAALKSVVGRFSELKAHGPIPQGAFLESMGISARIEVLETHVGVSKAERLQKDYERLVSPEYMGEIYKFMYFGNKEVGEVYPFLESLGFEKSK